MSFKSNKSSINNHPLVNVYLSSLESALTGTENQREVLESVQEHITDALPRDGFADRASVQKVLDDLGPVERIVSAQGSAPSPAPRSESIWPLAVSVIAASASLLLAFILPPLAAVVALVTLIWSIAKLRERETQTRPALALIAVIISGLTLVSVLAWVLFLIPASETVIIHSPIPVSYPVVFSDPLQSPA